MAETHKRSLDDLIVEAEKHPVSGWDFSWLGERLKTEPLPWDFEQVVTKHARSSHNMLDMGTGGGEWLAALPYRPSHTVATESWEPNIPIATERLASLGVEVIKIGPAPDNVLQDEHERRGRLPFADGAFELVINRHEAFVADEVARILTPGGRFLTQQLGDGVFQEFCELLGVSPPTRQPWSLARAVEQVERAGLTVTNSSEGHETVSFADVGALAWYLRMVPWTVPSFSVAVFRDRLDQLHRRIQAEGPLVLPLNGFYLEAARGDDAK